MRRKFNNKTKGKNKKALSTVVATVIIILLTVAAVTIVWTFVRNIINENKNQVESCFNIESSEKVTLNGMYTCFSNTDADAAFEEVQVSINIADADIDSLVISVEAGGEAKSIMLDNTPTLKPNMKPYGYSGSFGTEEVSLPEKNAGKTYVINFDGTSATKVDLIRIAPVVNSEQCGVTDQIYEVSDCALLG